MAGAVKDRVAADGPRWFDRAAPSDTRRMTGLADVMTAVAKAWTRDFATLSSAPGEITFKSATPSTLEAVLAEAKPHTAYGILHAATWSTDLGLRIDQAFVAAMVEAFFGGAGEETHAAAPGPLSPIETRIADMIGNQIADALTDGFSDVVPAAFAFEGLQAKLDPDLLGKPQAAVLIASFTLTTIVGAVDLDVLIPQVALDVIGAKLKVAFDPGRSTPDARWTERLEAEVSRTTVQLLAVIETSAMSLGTIAALQAGQVLALPAGADKKVVLKCEDRDLFRCELGQSAGLYTVRIKSSVGAD